MAGDKPPFYFSISRRLAGQGEYGGLVHDREKAAAVYMRHMLNHPYWRDEYVAQWRAFIAENSSDPAAVFVNERLAPEAK